MVKLADKFDSWQPITEDDAAIEAALADANIPALMCALVHVTGDPSIIRGDIKPSDDFFADANAGIDEAQQAQIRALALQALKAYRDRGCTLLLDRPDAGLIREMMDFVTGQHLPDSYEKFLESELALEGQDPYWQPGIEDLPQASREAFHVVVVGAGMSGLLAGYRLKQAGIPFTIVEKNDDVGGTWYENTYPGCRVDSPNHTYSYSFAPNDWPQHFSPQPVLLDYFRTCAEQMGVRDSIRFSREVEKSVYDEATGLWTVHVQGPNGPEQFTANAVVSATGQLNRPRMPDIPGQDRFTGPSWHSARWNWDVDLTGKRVGVIGTGASAFQFIPRIAEQAGKVTVFQRTPPWVSPREEYHDDISTQKHWLLNHVPFYAKWFRLFMFWRTSEGVLSMVRREPEYDNRDDAVSKPNEELRAMLTLFAQEMLKDRPDLIEKCIPDYPPAGKRMLVDNGTWFTALKRDDVELRTDKVAEITESGLVTEDGEAFEFDVLIYGTGFHASRIAWPQKFHGKDGRELQAEWDGDPHAYLGITVPGYPNLFLMYGPNTNIVVNGSIVFFSECEMRYILGCLKLLMETGHGAMEPKQAVHDAYNERIDAGNQEMAWGAPNVRSWYKNAAGRVTQNWPFTLLDYWTATLKPDPDDFEFHDPDAPQRKSA